jgi:hypothetical protein
LENTKYGDGRESQCKNVGVKEEDGWMDNFIAWLLRLEEKKGSMEWCRPCISEGINNVYA